MARRPTKISNVKTAIAEALASGHFRITAHCKRRMIERGISRREALYVLRNGRHEPRKDEFDGAHASWNYAMRGLTANMGKELRVVVAFDPDDQMFWITAIDLGKED
jgi:hypothetical protein